MVILVDTREQKPLSFKHDWITEVKTYKLNVGDYACQFKDGHIPNIYFERKTLTDLFGTMGHGYKRFKKEIQRTIDAKAKLILIVEEPLNKIYKGTRHSTLKGESIVKKLFTLWIKYGVSPVFCSNNKEMSDYITEFYVAYGKQYVKTKKKV